MIQAYNSAQKSHNLVDAWIEKIVKSKLKIFVRVLDLITELPIIYIYIYIYYR